MCTTLCALDHTSCDHASPDQNNFPARITLLIGLFWLLALFKQSSDSMHQSVFTSWQSVFILSAQPVYIQSESFLHSAKLYANKVNIADIKSLNNW